MSHDVNSVEDAMAIDVQKRRVAQAVDYEVRIGEKAGHPLLLRAVSEEIACLWKMLMDY